MYGCVTNQRAPQLCDYESFSSIIATVSMKQKNTIECAAASVICYIASRILLVLSSKDFEFNLTLCIMS